MKMKCLSIGFIFFTYIYVIWGQDSSFPTDVETFHVSDGNSRMITEPTSVPHSCPKDMLLYPGDSAENTWVCDCRPRFLYFPSFSLNNSCHEAYRQGPCPPKNYVILPKDEAVPRCVENPCMEDGVVPYNGTCYPLRIDSPCAPYGVLGVNETTFQLECVTTNIVARAVVAMIKAPIRTCPPGSRRSTLGQCRKVNNKTHQVAAG